MHNIRNYKYLGRASIFRAPFNSFPVFQHTLTNTHISYRIVLPKLCITFVTHLLQSSEYNNNSNPKQKIRRFQKTHTYFCCNIRFYTDIITTNWRLLQRLFLFFTRTKSSFVWCAPHTHTLSSSIIFSAINIFLVVYIYISVRDCYRWFVCVHIHPIWVCVFWLTAFVFRQASNSKSKYISYDDKWWIKSHRFHFQRSVNPITHINVHHVLLITQCLLLRQRTRALAPISKLKQPLPWKKHQPILLCEWVSKSRHALPRMRNNWQFHFREHCDSISLPFFLFFCLSLWQSFPHSHITSPLWWQMGKSACVCVVFCQPCSFCFHEIFSHRLISGGESKSAMMLVLYASMHVQPMQSQCNAIGLTYVWYATNKPSRRAYTHRNTCSIAKKFKIIAFKL